MDKHNDKDGNADGMTNHEVEDTAVPEHGIESLQVKELAVKYDHGHQIS
jgi:hypothetical protein